MIVEPGDGDRHAFLKPAADLFGWALANERHTLRAAIKKKILELYNETWRQEGDPALTAGELEEELEWQFLKISDCEIVPVVFSYEAGELFGGHCVDVEMDAELKFRGAHLVG